MIEIACKNSIFELISEITMVRILFLLLILIHAFIHLTGFLKAFNLTEIEQLTRTISRVAGTFWFLAFLLFVISAVAYQMESDWWWILGVVSVILSQVLIFLYWQDSKFGTIANAIIFASCLLGYGSWDFDRMVQSELEIFWSGISSDKTKVVTVDELKVLPPVVWEWMENVNVLGKERIEVVHFTQTGQMRTSPDGKWMPVEAEQYAKTASPGFLWIADVEAVPYIHLTGRDKYEDGRGHMLIKLLSLFPVADSRGSKIDQGTLLRYLAEMVWYPSAALEDYISWEQVDSSSARATMSYGDITASGIFEFDENNRVIRFEAKRYYDRKEGATLEPWVITIDENSYQWIEGMQIPTAAEVTWKLKEGDFTWYKLDIRDVKYFRDSEVSSLKKLDYKTNFRWLVLLA